MKCGWIVLGLAVFLGVWTEFTQVPEYFRYSIEEVCEAQGFQLEKHTIETSDGFLLGVFRVYRGVPKGPPVILVHGLASSAMVFVGNINAKSFAFRLVEAGFDVWMLNTRGNKFSRTHKKLSTESEEFWRWTMTHVSVIDIPETIDWVLEHTRAKQVGYVGYSSGANLIFLSLAGLPRLSQKIGVIISLAGAGNSMETAEMAFKYFGPMLNILEWLNISLLFDAPSLYFIKLLYQVPWLGALVWKSQYDIELHQDNVEGLSYYAYIAPGGTSLDYVKDFRELLTRKQHHKFTDLGHRNLEVFGQADPPFIDYSSVNATIALLGGEYDELVPKADCLYLKTQVSSVVFYKDDYPIDHVGFLLSRSDQHIQDVLRLLRKCLL